MYSAQSQPACNNLEFEVHQYRISEGRERFDVRVPHPPPKGLPQLARETGELVSSCRLWCRVLGLVLARC